jgi:hypothetical protein
MEMGSSRINFLAEEVKDVNLAREDEAKGAIA